VKRHASVTVSDPAARLGEPARPALGPRGAAAPLGGADRLSRRGSPRNYGNRRCDRRAKVPLPSQSRARYGAVSDPVWGVAARVTAPGVR